MIWRERGSWGGREEEIESQHDDGGRRPRTGVVETNKAPKGQIAGQERDEGISGGSEMHGRTVLSGERWRGKAERKMNDEGEKRKTTEVTDRQKQQKRWIELSQQSRGERYWCLRGKASTFDGVRYALLLAIISYFLFSNFCSLLSILFLLSFTIFYHISLYVVDAIR